MSPGPLLGAASQLPLALGGNALSGDNIGIALVSLLSIVGGYLLLAALWYFVFRQGPQERESQRRADQEALNAARGAPIGAASGSSPAPRAHTAAPVDAGKLRRRPGPRSRRR